MFEGCWNWINCCGWDFEMVLGWILWFRFGKSGYWGWEVGVVLYLSFVNGDWFVVENFKWLLLVD